MNDLESDDKDNNKEVFFSPLQASAATSVKFFASDLSRT